MDDEDIFIHGFGLSGYRSVGEEMIHVGPFKQLNLFVGQNNSGKSNILRFIRDIYSPIHKQRIPSLSPSDYFGRSDKVGVSAEILTNANSQRLKYIAGGNPHLLEIIDMLASHERLTRCDRKLVAHPFDVHVPAGGHKGQKQKLSEALAITDKIQNNQVFQKHQQLIWSNCGGVQDPYKAIDWLLKLISPIDNRPWGQMNVHFLNQVRYVGADPDESNLAHQGGIVWNGAMCIDQLARLQNPGGENVAHELLKQRRDTFQTFVEFIRDVIDCPDLVIQVNYDRTHLLFDFPYGVIPHESLGSGLHQVTLIAAATSIFPKSVWCLEEPELNLHPAWQKRLLSRLAGCDSQFFIATHSPALIDSGLAAVFHFEHDGTQTRSKSVNSDQQAFDVCADLGIRPSDLLQANCVIWVEGPSDRYYVKDWLRRVDSELVEHVHFSIMFYGGTLRSHLSGTDTDSESDESTQIGEADDFIKLCRLSRKCIFIQDRDTIPDPAKVRVEKEFRENPSLGYCIMTDGRTIENFVSKDSMKSITSKAFKKAAVLPDMSNALEWKIAEVRKIITRGKNAGKPVTECSGDDKVTLAKAACNEEGGLDSIYIDQVREHALRMSNFIRECCGMPARAN